MEREFVRWLCQRLPADARMLVGPGDDAAILRVEAEANVVATTDMLMEGVDFELVRHEPERIGRKALAVNLSDLAAIEQRIARSTSESARDELLDRNEMKCTGNIGEQLV